MTPPEESAGPPITADSVLTGARIAAGQKIDTSKIAGINSSLPMQEGWQNRVWNGYTAIGELHYACNFVGWCLSRLRLIPATVPTEPDGKPLVSDDSAVTAAVERLRGMRATHSELLRDFGRQFMLPGDCYLVGLAGTETQPERWEVRSLDEIRRSGSDVFLISKPGQTQGRKITSSDFLGRMWIQHPRYRELADSPSRAVLDALELLSIIQRAYRAIVRSRIPASAVVLLPQSWSPGPPDPTTSNAPGGESKNNPLIDDLEQAFITPTYDEGSASAVAPFIIEYPDRPDKEKSGLEIHEIPRALDQLLPKLEEQALRRLAQGLNVPVEIVFGLGDSNDWSGGTVEESIFREHIEPLAILICDSLTQAYLHPTLLDLGMSIEQASEFLIWYDASALVIHANRQKAASDGVKIGGIGARAWRREMGYSEEDAPTDEELSTLIAILSAGKAGQIPGEQPSQQPKRDVVEPSTPPNEPGSDDNPQNENSITSLGRTLYELDRDFLVAQHASAEAAMSRALDRAGARVSTLVRRNTDLTAVLRGATHKEAFARLGADVVAGLGSSPEALLEGSFTEHVRDFRRRAFATIDAALLAVNAPEDVAADTRAAFHTYVTARADEYEEALLARAAQLLTTPSFFTTGEGSYLEGSLVPLSLIRQVRNQMSGDPQNERGLTSGPIFVSALNALGLTLSDSKLRDNGDREWLIASLRTPVQDGSDA